MKKRLSLIIGFITLIYCYSEAQTNKTFTVKANQLKAEIQPTMYGVFFEDINLGADGGIYAELIKNRSFEFFKPLMGWTIDREKPNEGDILVMNRIEEMPSNPRYIRVKLNGHKKGDFGLINEGFRGMGIKSGLQYNFSVLARTINGSGQLHLELLDTSGNVIGASSLPVNTGATAWNRLSAPLIATQTVQKG